MDNFANLVRAWEGAGDFEKERIISRMEGIGTPEAWDFIRKVLLSREVYSHVRGWAARALGGCGDKEAMEALVNRLEWDPDPFVKAMCASSLAKMAERINAMGLGARERAVAALREAAQSSDALVRQKAAAGLARFMDTESRAAILDALGKLDVVEGMSDYEEMALSLCRMGEVSLSSVIAFARTMELSHDLRLAEEMMEAVKELMRRRHMSEMWRSRLTDAIAACRKRLDAGRRPSGETFVDKRLGVRFARPSIAEPNQGLPHKRK